MKGGILVRVLVLLKEGYLEVEVSVTDGCQWGLLMGVSEEY